MADDKKNSAKDLLNKHGEKIGLGVAVAALAAYVLFFYLPEPKYPELGKLKDAARQRENEMKTSKDGDKPTPPQPWEQKAVSPWNTVLNSSVKGADVWAASLRTEVSETTKQKPKQLPPVALAPSTAFENLEVNLDNVTLSWSVRDWTAKEKAELAKTKDPKKIPVELTGFKIERDVNASGKWETIATLDDPKARTYKDTKIEAKTRYAYRITALSTKKEFLENGGEDGSPNPSGVAAVLSSPPATTLGIWKISYANASRPENAEKGMVYVTIEKYEKSIGAKVERKQIHRDGDKIGWKDAADGGEPTSKHRVQVGTKSHEVDFDTGITLVSVKAKKVTVQITKCKRKFGPGGVPDYPCDREPVSNSFNVHEIVTTGPEGKQVILVPNPKDHPNGKDQYCPECSGSKPIIGDPKEEKKPEPPKEDPAAVAAKKKEADAKAAYDEAVKLLKAGKKKEALPKLESLLKEFATTEFSKGQRADIEQKLAEAQK